MALASRPREGACDNHVAHVPGHFNAQDVSGGGQASGAMASPRRHADGEPAKVEPAKSEGGAVLLSLRVHSAG